MNKVTLTITTCKRLSNFKQTVESFFENCLDLDLIKEIIIIDDGSSETDLKRMFELLSKYEYDITVIEKKNKGHARSINLLFNRVKTDYIFHLEDDWHFSKKENFIKHAFEIMNHNEKIKSVIFRNWIKQGARQTLKQKTNTGIDYYIHNYNGLKFKKGEVNTYPGYSLNPSLQNVKEIKKLGLFENAKLFELRFAYKYFLQGFLIGLTNIDYCVHMGGDSAYKLNNSEA